MPVGFSRRLGRAVLVGATIVLAAVCALPSWAQALDAAPAVREGDVSIGALSRSRHARTVQLPIRADMVGVTWRGSAAGLQLRTQAAHGRWSSWIDVNASGDGPDPMSVEGRHAVREHTIATPVLVDDAQRVQLRTRAGARITDAAVQAINVSGTATPGARVVHGITARAAKLVHAVLPSADAQAMQPLIHPRSSWRAASPRGNAGYGDRVLGVVVHHTVSTNSYTCASVPALLRGIQRYHIHTNGWFDIGYNFVVDRCGGIWEARGGGITQAVIGAHTAGFNTDTVGIALLGTYTTARPTRAARRALERLIAWRLDLAHVLPNGTTKLIARSSDKFPVGTRVTTRAVSGHRDLYPTSCPGNGEYQLLRSDAAVAYRVGGLKVGNITTAPNIDPISGQLRHVVVRSVSTNAKALMRIAVEQSSTGAVLGQISGRTRVLKYVSGGLSVPAWDVRVRVTAAMPGQRARTYLEPLMRYSADPGLTITAPPATSTAQASVLTASYTLASTAQITAELRDPATGERVAKLLLSASSATLPTSDGTLSITIPASIEPGTYDLVIRVPADTAPGRSIRHFPLTVTASQPTTAIS